MMQHRTGVSNFDSDQLAELLKVATRVKPALVQRNSDPFSADRNTRAFCAASDIQFQVANVPLPTTHACMHARTHTHGMAWVSTPIMIGPRLRRLFESIWHNAGVQHMLHQPLAMVYRESDRGVHPYP